MAPVSRQGVGVRDKPEPSGPPKADRPGSDAPWREAELRRLIDDISARLHRVCQHMPQDEFAALVADIARLRMRFDGSHPNDD